ncbi:MAG: hypothetical protein HRU26_09070 [Psychroserpens sp.]|nr:hypothetical protein [Psychroserpens sp.]
MTEEEARLLSLPVKKNNNRYSLTLEQALALERIRQGEKSCVAVSSESDTITSDYAMGEGDVMSAINPETGKVMDMDAYCSYYNLPRGQVRSWKLLTHTRFPIYNIVFKEVETEITEESVDFEAIFKKHANNIVQPRLESYVDIPVDMNSGFDRLVYTDVHIAMDTNAKGTSMYASPWSKEVILRTIKDMAYKAIDCKRSNTIVVDELGDFLDGFNGYTTRGGHKLPQNMTDEEAFDLGVEVKMEIADILLSSFEHVIFNNICNDNHAGSFGYFVNSAFKSIIERKYGSRVACNNYRNFINHYVINDIAMVITHGKDEDTLKFGFKPILDSKGLEKIDQYAKVNGLYKHAKIVFSKGDSHQAMFDMATSDDFYYFNYPALSPSSQWVQNNFKKGRRGFVLEHWSADHQVTLNMQLRQD